MIYVLKMEILFLYFDEIYDGVIKLLDYEFSKDEFYDILIEIANTGKIKIEEDEYYLKEYFDSENILQIQFII